ncbi:hypothetical protein AMAG_17842 [Allomyces macrogynus ATCC 38327]|uniref:Helicase C-terminal domain-containing protein n=1 Tax=Allomyces macrogynus (strain ATCC 38327) TaxID=578462 RepID=A0A0L0S027_ALLM3|nr:hypothetical protein AMAG_17842 [Allomyces macrogynus ATCC 38327]|eukprot:KNE55923.1 hypothetical protein AMAG_17842 [Allomyces macrogynus ATCC 38327]
MTQSCPHLVDWVQIATYDGDTTAADRVAIRERAHILLTNPDMLHITVQAYHGVFGSHCAWIIRRLRRLADYYQNPRVQFIACSATIGNAEEHVRDLFGTDFTHISEDGSPHGQRATVIWTPPVLNLLAPRSRGRLPKQQAGRAGWCTRDSLSILVPDANPLDQFYARHPDRIWDAQVPAVAMDPRHPALVEAHLVCAAFELLIDPDNEPALEGFELQEPMEKRLTQGDSQERFVFPCFQLIESLWFG